MARVSAGRPCTVYGDGRQSRDFIFVSDVVAACRSALDGRGLGGLPVNVGTGVETSLLDLLSALAEASGREPVVEFAAARDGDIRRSCAVCDRARELLDFGSSVAFADGLGATWSWHVTRDTATPATAVAAAGHGPTV